jgi:hypothetical protein
MGRVSSVGPEPCSQDMANRSVGPIRRIARCPAQVINQSAIRCRQPKAANGLSDSADAAEVEVALTHSL